MSTTRYAALMLPFFWMACASPEPEPEPAPTLEEEDNLDTIFSTWSDESTPEAGAPIWYAQSLRLAGSSNKLTKMGFLEGSKSREPVVLFQGRAQSDASTGGFRLRPGAYGILVQFHEDVGMRFDRVLGTTALVDAKGEPVPDAEWLILPNDETTATGDVGGWRRAYFRFSISEAQALGTYTLRIRNAAAAPTWRLGAVVVHREGRPFWAIGHNPNSLALVRKALEEGANAVEPDLSYTTESGTRPRNERITVTEEGSAIKFGCPIDNFGHSKIDDYMRFLNENAPGIPVIWDAKPGGCKREPMDYPEFARAFVEASQRTSFDLSHSVFNITTEAMAPVFGPLPPYVGRAWDGITVQVQDHADAQWLAPLAKYGLTFQGLGVTPILQNTAKWTKPIATYVRSRERGQRPEKLYFWTVNSDASMRRALDFSIDGLISDEIPKLRALLSTFPYSHMYRYAGPEDNIHQRYAPGWIQTVGSSSPDK